MPPRPHRAAPRLPRGVRTLRFGNYDAGKRGARRFDIRDPYRFAVSLTWPRFMLALFAAELVLNFVFALLYLLRPGSIANAHPGSLADAFFFSIETLATVGYGEMYPADLYGHLISSAEIIIGVAFVAIATGLIFVRVSRPKPSFRYADDMVVARYRGVPTLMVRIAGSQLGVLYDAQARLSVLVPEDTAEGLSFRNIVELPLLRPSIPVFPLSWTIMHVVDEASPLYGLDAVTMEDRKLRFFLMIRAEDTTLSNTVRGLRAYDPGQIRFGMRYVDALEIMPNGLPVLDLARIGDIEPEPAPAAVSAGAR